MGECASSRLHKPPQGVLQLTLSVIDGEVVSGSAVIRSRITRSV